MRKVEDQIKAVLLPLRMSRELDRRADELIEEILGTGDSSCMFKDGSLFERVKVKAERRLGSLRMVGGFSVLVPVGFMGLAEGISLPDMDISLLGIGRHRFFLFHSALPLLVLRLLYKRWIRGMDDESRPLSGLKKKVTGALVGGCALGVAVHLTVDVFQPKSVIFPFLGSLAEGTLVDDNIWLMGNALWAFKISRDVFAVAFAEELEAARNFVVDRFGSLPELLKGHGPERR